MIDVFLHVNIIIDGAYMGMIEGNGGPYGHFLLKGDIASFVGF